jgi:hypothetical protein
MIGFGVGLILSVFCLSRALDAYWKSKDEANLQRLNAFVASYAQASGKTPDVNLIDLYKSGITDRRLQPTPFGGFYRYDAKARVVYNPHRQESHSSIQTLNLGR